MDLSLKERDRIRSAVLTFICCHHRAMSPPLHLCGGAGGLLHQCPKGCRGVRCLPRTALHQHSAFLRLESNGKEDRRQKKDKQFHDPARFAYHKLAAAGAAVLFDGGPYGYTTWNRTSDNVRC